MAAEAPASARAEEQFRKRQAALHSHVDRTFAVLLGVQWVVAIAAGIWTSGHPSSAASQALLGLWAAIFLAGALALVPILLVLRWPGALQTRCAIGAAQILLASLLTQLTGAGLQAHFYVFGSLALLSFYRDWHVFVPAAAALAAGSILRGLGLLSPVVAFLTVSQWGWAEHIWVLCELAVLVAVCLRAERDMREAASRSAELEVSGQTYRAVLERSSEGICLVDPKTKEVLEANDAFRRVFPLDDPNGPSIVDLLAAQGGSSTPGTHEWPYLRPDGSQLNFRVTVSTVVDGSRDALCIVVRDVTEHLRAQAALKDSEERYTLAARASNDGLWDWDLKSGKVQLSPRWNDMLGLPHQPVVHQDNWLSRLHPEDRRSFDLAIKEHLDGGTGEFQHEHRIQHADGTFRWVLFRGVAVLDAEGTPSRMAGSQTDVTSRHAFEEQLEHAVFHDTLTGLANRAFFSKLLTQAIARARRNHDYQFAVLFVDLDRFKIINDSLGHLVGDELLKELAWRLKSLLRTEDTIARFGGDEFTILLDGIHGPDAANEVASRIRAELETPFYFGSHEICVTASIGIALGSTEHVNGEDLLRNADIAMYRAKTLGKNRHETFDAEMHQTALARLTMENEIRRALEWHEFTLCYQPIVSLRKQTIVGFEALVRWTRRDGKKVSPGEFIPVAEETGLILPLGRQVLSEACRQVALWQKAFPSAVPLSVAVNLAPRELEQPRFVDQVAAIIDGSDIAPGSLHLELTERSLVDGSEVNLARLRDLKALSVQLYLDDFGTGYSSLSYLHRFPLDVIKIDQSFIQRMEANRKDDTLVGAIITLGKKLGMEVVAEGVETASQLHQLKATDCDFVQGHFLAPPREAQEIEELLQRIARGDAHLGELFKAPRSEVLLRAV